MANYVVSDSSLGSVADAIRQKGGTSAPLEYPAEFISAIEAISTADEIIVTDVKDGQGVVTRTINTGDNPVTRIVRGAPPLDLDDAKAGNMVSLTQQGLCTQSGTPTPDAPVDIVTNNGAIKARRQSGLPLGYQRVEWLKSAGAILITGFKTKSTQEITTVFYRERSGASYLYSSDTATSGTTNTTAYLTSGAGNWRWDGKSYSIAVSTGIRITSVQNKDGVWLNGTRTGWYSDAGEFVSNNDLRLSSGENTTVRIYSMTIREGETVTLDLVPVQRVTDNAYGFYDKVSGNFYTNAEATFAAGDPIADPVEVYTDGTSEVLTVSGKNLFDRATVGVVQGTIGNITGSESDSNYRVRTGFVPVKPSTTYTASAVISGYTSSSPNGLHVFEFSSAEQSGFIQASGWQPPAGYTFTTGATTNYIRFVFAVSSNTAITPSAVSNIQLELGSTATAYQPYTAPQTASVPMLLSVGDVKDDGEIISGLLTHKVGVMVFDGTENWRASSSANIYILDSAIAVGLAAICTHFVKVPNTTSAANMQDGSFKGHASNAVLYFKDVSAGDVNGFKAFLAAQYAAGTPVIVLYKLATETTEQITPQPFTVADGSQQLSVQAEVSGMQVEAVFPGAFPG